MVKVQVMETVACTPDEFLEFVMDIERYAEVDKKINPILWQRREGDLLEFACRPTLAGLPQPKVVQQARLTPGVRIDISLSPLPHNRLAHATAHFEASFECTPIVGGTQGHTDPGISVWARPPVDARAAVPEAAARRGPRRGPARQAIL